MSTRVRELLMNAARNSFPATDGLAEVVPATKIGPHGDEELVVEFTGHAIIATTRSCEDVRTQEPDGFGRATTLEFLTWLAGNDAFVQHQNLVLGSLGEGTPLPPRTTAWDECPRVRNAQRARTDLEVFGDERCCVTLGCGTVGRRELGVEVSPNAQNGQIGRDLLSTVRAGIPLGEPVFAQVAPGNTRALRTVLAAGFHLIGFEILLRRSPAASNRIHWHR